MALPDPDTGAANASPREGRRGAEEARGAQGRAEVRQANAEGRAGQVGRRHRRQDEGVERARVAPGCRQGARAEAHGGARHLRQPPRPRPRCQAARACSSRSSRSNALASAPGQADRHRRPFRGREGERRQAAPRRDPAADLGCLSVSATTRAAAARPRWTGVDYFFVSDDAFDADARRPTSCWSGRRSSITGTGRRAAFVERAPEAGRDVHPRDRRARAPSRCGDRVPDAVLIFLAPPVDGRARSAGCAAGAPRTTSGSPGGWTTAAGRSPSATGSTTWS